MSSITPGVLQSVGTAALNTYQQTKSALANHPDLVALIDPATNTCLLQFDAVINEQHSRDAQVTTFPVESGQLVTDHILVAPPEITIQGIITDSPIGNRQALITEAIATGVTLVAPPLLVAAAGAAYGASSTYKADQGTASHSKTAFAKLLALQGGDPESSPPVRPSLVHVQSKLKLYENMAIKSVSVPRDRTVSNAIVVQISLQKIFLVSAQTVDLSILGTDAPLLAGKANEGEKPTAYVGLQGYGAGNSAGVGVGGAVVKASKTVLGVVGLQ